MTTPSTIEGLRPGGRFGTWLSPPPAFIALDVDGTLLGGDERLPPDLGDAVVRCQNLGLRVGLATGRSVGACRRLLEELRLDGPHVFHNGAVRHLDGDVTTWPLSEHVARRLPALAHESGIYLELSTTTGHWPTDERPELAEHRQTLGGASEGRADACDPTQVLEAAFVTFPGDDVDGLRAALTRIDVAATPSYAPSTPTGTFWNITRPGIDKGTTLRATLKETGTLTHGLACVGDGPNDLSMFALAGTAIAMADAPSSVREQAHLIAPRFADQGAAVALHALAAHAEQSASDHQDR